MSQRFHTYKPISIGPKRYTKLAKLRYVLVNDLRFTAVNQDPVEAAMIEAFSYLSQCLTRFEPSVLFQTIGEEHRFACFSRAAFTAASASRDLSWFLFATDRQRTQLNNLRVFSEQAV